MKQTSQPKPRKYRKLSLFQAGQDLPLFTGAPDRAPAAKPEAVKVNAVQLSLF